MRGLVAGGGLLRLVLVALLVSAGARLVLFARRLPLGRLAEVAELGPPAELRLLFLFQPGDCESYDGLVTLWNEIHRGDGVEVTGVGLRFPADTAARRFLLRNAGADFPVRFDLARAVETMALRLGYGRTPVSLLVDDRGRPVAVLPPASDPAVQERYGELVRTLSRPGAAPTSHPRSEDP